MSREVGVGGLSRRWNSIFAVLVVLSVGSSLLSFLVFDSLIGDFSDAATEVDEKAALSAELRSAVQANNASAFAMIQTGIEARERFLANDTATAALFDEAELIFTDPDESAALERARVQWDDLLGGLRRIAADEASFAFGMAVLKSSDENFAMVEANSAAMSASLAELEGVASRELGRQLERGFDTKRTLSVLLGVGAVAGLAYILYVRRRLRRDILNPIHNLTEAASLFADGRLDHRAAVERGDELGKLAENFNAMADAIEVNQQTLKGLAFADSVTGLPNRAALSDAIGSSEAGDGAAPVLPDCAMFIDIDDFKHVNDALGHDAGDVVLRLVAERLQAAVRDTDVLARIGGDEFAVVMLAPSDLEAACVVAQRMLDLMVAPFEVSGVQVVIGVSIGVAVRTDRTADPAELLQQADNAMYVAKASGKNRYEVYDSTTPAEPMARVEPESLPGLPVGVND